MYPQVEYSGDLRKARKNYRCGAIREISCVKQILSGDIYFSLTEKKGLKFRAYRYCLDCAQELYPELVKSSSEEVKGRPKQRAVGVRFKRAVFAERQSRYFRRRGTPPEEYLWSFLKNKQLGLSFYRQKVLRGFVVDFWCPDLKLALELDGRQHLSRKAKDAERDKVLSEHGITVLRFPVLLVYSDLHVIIDAIREFKSRL
jgi:very-short-patch-repair endonuclease